MTCKCGKEMYYDNDRDVCICSCGNEVENTNHPTAFSGDKITCPEA